MTISGRYEDEFKVGDITIMVWKSLHASVVARELRITGESLGRCGI